MSFTPRRVHRSRETQSHALDTYQRKVLLGMLGMVLLTFLASNMWALLWQGSDWLVASVLPAVVVDLTNDAREDTAAPTLRRSEVLDEAAQRKAEHMAAEGYFAHYSPDGVTPWHWFSEVSYEFVHAGENLAVHFTDTHSLVQAWMDSPTHRENIMNHQFTEIGVGTARGRYQGFDTVFVVQLFGTPAAPTPTDVSVDVEAAESATAPALAAEATTSDGSVTVAGEQSAADESTELAAAPDASTTPEVESSRPQSAPEPEPVSDTAPDAPTQATASDAAADTVTAAPEDDAAATTSPATSSADTYVDAETAFAIATAGGTRPSMVYQTGLHTTSTDKVVATSGVAASSGGRLVGILGYLTQPQYLMQGMYVLLSVGVLVLLLWAIMLEARRHQFIQMAYSFGILLLMVGCWYVHVALTSGAVIL